jgi:hypothetical protein
MGYDDIISKILAILAKDHRNVLSGNSVPIDPILRKLKKFSSMTTIDDIAEIFDDLAHPPYDWIKYTEPGKTIGNSFTIAPLGIKAIENFRGPWK